jgi:hypothetical protein
MGGGNPYQKYTKQYPDGTFIEVQSLSNMGKTDIIKIVVPGEKVPPPPVKKGKIKDVKEETTEEWVFLLGICAEGTYDGGDLLGVLVVDQQFNVRTYFKNDGSKNFDGFSDWNRYYGFRAQWGTETAGGKYELEELPRLSEMWLLEEDDSIESTDTDTGWVPGNCPYGITDLLPSDVHGPNAAFSYWLQDGYTIESSYAYTETMGNTTFSSGTTEGGSHYSEVAYASNGYGVEDLRHTGTNDSFMLFHWMQGRYHSAFYAGGLPLWSHIDEYEDHPAVAPWPSDGIQRRTVIHSWEGDDWFYFEKDGVQGEQILTRHYSDYSNRSSWVEGVWTYTQESTEEVYHSELFYPYQGDCCTVTNPLDCLPQDVFPNFSKWMTLAVTEPEFSESKTYSPCSWSFEWGDYPPYYQVYSTYSFSSSIHFDDGHIEKMAGNMTEDTSDASWGKHYTLDCAIYNWGKEPIYAAHYHHAGSNNENSLIYYFNGKFFASEKFQNYNYYSVDAFDSSKNYNGYWDGQVRCARLKRTTIEETEEEVFQ